MEGMTSLEREISRLHKAILESPSDIELKLKYGHACLMRDWRLEALRIYQEVLDQEDNAAARLALVKIFVMQGYYVEAYNELRKLFNLDPINLQGHIMLHIIKEHEPVPEDLARHCDFVPSLKYLNEQVAFLLKDRDLLDSQIAEYSALVFGVAEPEPVLQYFVMETRKCKERLVKFLAKCDEWSKSAVDTGEYSGGYDGESHDYYHDASYSAVAEDVNILANADEFAAPIVFGETGESGESGADIESAASAEIAVPAESAEIAASTEPAASAASAEAADVIETDMAKEAEMADNTGSASDGGSDEATSAETEADSEMQNRIETNLSDEDNDHPAADLSVQDNDVSVVSGTDLAASDADTASPADAPIGEAVPTEIAAVNAIEQDAAGADEPNVTGEAENQEKTADIDIAQVKPLMEQLFNTRGVNVNSVLLYRRNAGVLASLGTSIDSVETFMAVSVGMEAWNSLSSDVSCWILEGAKGMVYIQKLTRDNLLIIDSASTNLGALRISVDKIIPSLEEAL